MLETKIDELIAALKENTAARLGEGGKAPAKTPAKADAKAPAKKPAAKKLTAEQVRAKVLEVKDKHGMDRAKEIIAESGADDLADLLKNYAEQYDAVYASAETALEEEAEEEAADDDGL